MHLNMLLGIHTSLVLCGCSLVCSAHDVHSPWLGTLYKSTASSSFPLLQQLLPTKEWHSPSPSCIACTDIFPLIVFMLYANSLVYRYWCIYVFISISHGSWLHSFLLGCFYVLCFILLLKLVFWLAVYCITCVHWPLKKSINSNGGHVSML